METRRLGGNLLLMRDPIALDHVVRANLLADINNLRSLTAMGAIQTDVDSSMLNNFRGTLSSHRRTPVSSQARA